MTWTVTVGGQTFSNTNLDGTAYADEVNGFPALLAAFASEAGFLKGIGNTSTTSFTPSITTQTLTLDQTPAHSVGLLVCAKSASDATHYIIGPIAAINGNDIDIAVTIAGGGTAKADWVVTYPISGNVFDSNGDFGTPNGSLSAKGLDNDLGAGGGRVVSDFDPATGTARVGATWGGGDPIKLLLHVNGFKFLETHPSSTNKTWFAANVFNDGSMYYAPWFGTFASSTCTISWTTHEAGRLTIGAGAIIDYINPGADNAMAKTLFVIQDGTGGRVPTLHRDGVLTQIKWTSPEPNWAAQGAGEVTRLTAQYAAGWLYLSAVEDIQS